MSKRDHGVRPGTSIDQPDTDGRAREAAATDGQVLSPVALGLALVTAVGGVVLVGQSVPLWGAGELLGLLLAGGVYGLVGRVRRYVETAVAGAIAGAGTVVAGAPLLTLLGFGLPGVVVGAVTGVVATLAGHYLGRDLRDGLTRDL